MSFLAYDFMQRALVAALLVGLAAPAIGTFLVQRRLSLMGDGIGHIALTGVALGFLLRTAPRVATTTAVRTGDVAIELVRERGKASGDVALALLFYGGIAGGALLIKLSPGGTNNTLVGYLFGSLSNVTMTDLWVIVGLSVSVLLLVAVFSRELFAVCQDEEVARVMGLRVRFLNLLVAVGAAVTVTVAMRVVGLLLVSALMVVPVATTQQLTRSFRATLVGACLVGALASVSGLVLAFYADTPPGASTVVLALGAFLVAAIVGAGRRAVSR
jgi:zinc transport system permease protein